MYKIELFFNRTWIVIGTDFLSQDSANWAIAAWKQANRCEGDRGFRVTPQ